jgi:hypothetical protein
MGIAGRIIREIPCYIFFGEFLLEIIGCSVRGPVSRWQFLSFFPFYRLWIFSGFNHHKTVIIVEQ